MMTEAGYLVCMDHGRHKQPATPASFRSGIPVIRHRECGGRVYKTWQYWECALCDKRWRHHIVEKWPEAETEARFYLDGDRDPEAYAIVWVTEGKNRFTKLVPASEAHKYEERFKL